MKLFAKLFGKAPTKKNLFIQEFARPVPKRYNIDYMGS